MDLVVGSDGSTYVTGVTYSPGFPTTPGAFDRSFGGNGLDDAFVSKFDPTGATLLYSTFLGGASVDGAAALSLGPGGSVYVAGFTSSEDFPTTPGAFDRVVNGGDGFVTRLSDLGDALLYSSYLGGSSANAEGITALAVAADGTTFVTGHTYSSDFPTTPGAFDRVLNNNGLDGYSDAFITALTPSGSDLLLSTFLGGSYNDYGYQILAGPRGAVYVSGDTQSLDFPATQKAFDPTFNGGQDAFVTCLKPSGTGLVFSTFLGGIDHDDGRGGIGLDSRGNVYVAGNTTSPDFPTTPGAFDTTINDFLLGDAYATKLNQAGRALAYSTYIGGTDTDAANDLVVAPDRSVILTGFTLSSDFPTTAGAFDRTRSGGGDAFVTRLNRTGGSLAYSSYLGGTAVPFDEADAVALAGPTSVSVAGYTVSDDFPTTPGAYDTSYNGDFDAFLATFGWPLTVNSQP